MRKEQHSPVGFYTIGVAALFLAGFFLLVAFGAVFYLYFIGLVIYVVRLLKKSASEDSPIGGSGIFY